MGKRAEPRGSATKPTRANPGAKPLIIPAQNQMGGTVYAAWLAAVGAVLGGLSGVLSAAKTQQQSPPPDPTIEDCNARQSGIGSAKIDSDRTIAAADTLDLDLFWEITKPSTGSKKTPITLISTPNHKLRRIQIEPFLKDFAQSSDLRNQFVLGVRVFSEGQTALSATDGEKAISALFDAAEPTGVRVAAAFYLGAHGKEEYIAPLKVTSTDTGAVGIASQIALEMLNEQRAPMTSTSQYILRSEKTPNPEPKKK